MERLQVLLTGFKDNEYEVMREMCFKTLDDHDNMIDDLLADDNLMRLDQYVNKFIYDGMVGYIFVSDYMNPHYLANRMYNNKLAEGQFKLINFSEFDINQYDIDMSRLEDITNNIMLVDKDEQETYQLDFELDELLTWIYTTVYTLDEILDEYNTIGKDFNQFQLLGLKYKSRFI
jgi:hypothetical protein